MGPLLKGLIKQVVQLQVPGGNGSGKKASLSIINKSAFDNIYRRLNFMELGCFAGKIF